MAHVTVFSKSVTNLTLTNVFFTALLYNLKHVQDENFPASAGTDGITLTYNPTWFETFDVKEGTFTLAHEIGHVILFHSLRRGIRQLGLWNLACDHAVNLLLKEHGFVPYPTDPCDTKFTGMSAEQIYDLLMQEQKAQGGEGEPSPSGAPREGDVQDYQPSKNGNMTAQEVERQIGIGLEKALQAAKAAGTLSKEQREALRAAQVVKEPWYSHLRRYISIVNAREYNWAHVDQRRMSYTSIVMPEMKSESLGKIVVSIDESGSLTNDQLSAIGAHLTDICKMCAPKELVIIRHTDEVTDVEVMTGPDYDLNLVRKSSGGTDFRPVFDLIEREHSDAQVTLMFTDMYGPMPDHTVGDALWITSSQGMKAPFGEIINADFND